MSGLAPNIGASGKVRLYYFEDYDFYRVSVGVMFGLPPQRWPDLW